MFFIHDNKVFVIANNECIAASTSMMIRPSSWFQGEHDAFFPNFNEMQMQAYGWDLTPQITKPIYKSGASMADNYAGVILQDGVLYEIITVNTKRKLIPMAPNVECIVPYAVRLGRLNRLNNLYFSPNFTVLSGLFTPQSESLTCDGLIEYVRQCSKIGSEFSDFGRVFMIDVDKIYDCVQLAHEKKWVELDAMWEVRDFGEVTIATKSLEDLQPFTWETVDNL